jgi:putative membrane-bound dehydrogenase-like protein
VARRRSSDNSVRIAPAGLAFVFSLATLILIGAGSGSTPAAEVPPKSLDPRIEIGLFAESPQIVTPTDVSVDHLGRVWAIESNTHFRPPHYKGHASDRVLVFYDDDRDGKADRVETFADGFVHAMSIAVRLNDGVYVATRKEVFHLTDANGDGKADQRRVILRLDTPGDYPHNGLAGFAFDGLGYLYIGLGENLGADYRLIGSDGRTLTGGGEGGSIFRCRTDGSDLTLWATGFWNPHASCVDAFGRMFTVDNDPDDRPPCRMVHVIPGGDYGYRFRNGRRGIHPFTAWDGELPGTLQMVSGTGEAPCGIVPYESDAFPAEYRGALLVTSWGDHRIDRFPLRPQGTSFTSKAEPLIVGGENFRPVGLALAPDGSLIATDWVLKDYTLHGHGRIWRIRAKSASRHPAIDDLAAVPKLALPELRHKLDSPRMDIRRLAARTLFENNCTFLEDVASNEKLPPRQRLEAKWALARQTARVLAQPPAHSSLKNVEIPLLWPDLEPPSGSLSETEILEHLHHPSAVNPSIELSRLVLNFDLDRNLAEDQAFLDKVLNLGDRFVFAAVVQALADRFHAGEFALRLRPERTPSAQTRLALLLAARQSKRDKQDVDVILPTALADPDFGVRRTAVQWVGEERLAQLRPQIELQLSDPTATSELFEATIASLEMFEGKKRAAKDEFSGADYALRLARNDRAADRVRALALRMVPPRHKGLDIRWLKSLLASSSSELRFEAVRTLRETSFPETPALLRRFATDSGADRMVRLEAIAGLASVLQRDVRDAATLGVLRRLLDEPDFRLAALRALRRSFRDAEVQTAVINRIKAADVRTDASRELADQAAVAFRMSGIAVPKLVESRATPRPASAAEWVFLAESGGNPVVGEKLFAHPNAGGCANCHSVHGRGGTIGPDLSVIARSSNRTKLAESIVRPSKEIAPQFTSWTFVTREGRVVVGVLVAEDREGHLRIGTTDGTVVELNASEVEERHPQTKSVMPEGLIDALTPAEFRDLVAFLAHLD